MPVNEFPLPDLGEGLTEGEILKWLVSEGEVIELNQPIVEVETAKAAVEIPAKWAGRVVKIHHPEGSTVNVGDPIIAIDTSGDAAPAATPAPAAQEAASSEGGLIGETTAGGRTAVLVGYGPRNTAAKRRQRVNGPTAPVEEPVAVEEAAPGPVLAKPPVRKLARDLGIDLSTVAGTGPQGSITRDDVTAAVNGAAPATTGTTVSASRETRIPVKGVRKLTAANMVASAFTAPHVTEFLTIDMTRSMRALERLKAQRDWREVRVSPLLLVAKACLLGITRYPMINSTWSDATEEIIVKNYVNLGIAAATERGLIVPNIKDAERLSLRELADSLNAVVSVARSGKTAPADMTGGTFTITNVGVFGIDSGTPILPPGEAAILAFGAVREQPWVHEGEIKVRQVSTLALSFDHRIIDGELGSLFLRDVGDFLTDPETALLAWT